MGVAATSRWSALEVRHLAALVAVAETGSFAVAARRLGYTQPAISQQIRALERLVDHQLVVRHPGGRRPAELTPVGETVLGHSRAVLAQVTAAYADLREA